MRTELLDYELPKELIAQTPAHQRSASRLLVMDRTKKRLIDRVFTDITEYLGAGDCLVLNNTKVLPARFFARRQTGAAIEGLFLTEQSGLWQVMLKNARKVKEGEILQLLDHANQPLYQAKAVRRLDDGTWLIDADNGKSVRAILEKIGYAPLPPYIKRQKDEHLAAMDLARYQTVYAEKSGAVAAPTAGLHFTEELITELKAKGVRFANITLHVGAGTFKPVAAENLADHKMHSERFSITEEDARIINQTRKAKGRVIAVGTTSVRTLESIAQGDAVAAAQGSTELFIMPGYQFKIVDAMVTNFHLPRSTLLALVAAFAGLDEILAAYRHAVEMKYRFYSYGDAMLII